VILHRASLVLVIAATGQLACSEIVGIEDRSGRWCTLEAGEEDFCDDFDHDPAFGAWTAGGSPRTTASDRSEPNALLAETGTTLSRSFREARAEFSVALDVRLMRLEADELGPSHAVVRVQRGASTIALFAGSAGGLSFGADLLGEQLSATLAGGEWKRFVISIGGDTVANATLEVNGEIRATAKLDGEGDPDKGTSVVIGAHPETPDPTSIQCIIDNVTVNGAGVAP
jgi:hypothetical protein